MKRILCLLFAFCTVFLLASCSGSNGPVPFFDKLSKGKECYIEVTEITPQTAASDLSDMYCKCTLSDGGTVWMAAAYEDYIRYIDSEVPKQPETVSETVPYQPQDELAYSAKKITYEKPVRLDGTVFVTDNELEDYSSEKKTKVFRLGSADSSVLNQPCQKTSTAVPYTENLRNKTIVSAAITDIAPKYTVEPLDKEIICECTASDSKTFRLCITTSDYKKIFDSSALFNGFNSNYKDKVELGVPIKITGITLTKEDVLGKNPLLSSGVSDHLVKFLEADQESVDAEKESKNVSYNVIRVTPLYTNSYGSIVICECDLATDGKVLMRISTKDYRQIFDADFSYSTYDKLLNQEQATVTEYDSPVTLNGVAVNREDILSEFKISEDTPDKAFDFKEKE